MVALTANNNMKKLLIGLVCLAGVTLCANAQLTNRTYSQTTISNMIYTNMVLFSNNMVLSQSNQIYQLTNSAPWRSLYLGINTNFSVIRPDSVTNTLIITNGIISHVVATNVPF